MNTSQILSYGLILLSFAISHPSLAKPSNSSKVEEEIQAELKKQTPTPDAKNAEDSYKMEIQVKEVEIKTIETEQEKSEAPSASATPPKDTAHATAHGDSPTVPADKALGWLKNGNTRFVKNRLRNDGQSKKDIARLSSGQHPHAIILSCSDSRVPPELIFDQKLGEIFVVRTAGEALDNAAIASIEYAVEHLGPQLLVVMGHESCGAVKAAHSTFGGKDAGSSALNALVHDIQPRIASSEGKEPSKGFISEAKTNASGVAQDLIARSKIIEEKVKTGALKLQTALYYLSDGTVEFY